MTIQHTYILIGRVTASQPTNASALYCTLDENEVLPITAHWRSCSYWAVTVHSSKRSPMIVHVYIASKMPDEFTQDDLSRAAVRLSLFILHGTTSDGKVYHA